MTQAKADSTRLTFLLFVARERSSGSIRYSKSNFWLCSKSWFHFKKSISHAQGEQGTIAIVECCALHPSRPQDGWIQTADR
jgi:hypothetical protein